MSSNKDLVIQTAKDLPVGADGMVKFENIHQQLLWSDSMIQSGMLPKSYTKASQVVAAMQMASEVGLKGGITTLRRTANINGTPSMFGELPLAVVQASGKLAGMITYYFDKDGKKIHPDNNNLHQTKHGFFCQMTRDNGTVYYDFYTVDDAIKAGLGNVWKKHPEDMLRWRVIAKVIKTLFADIISGAPIAEYDFNTLGEVDRQVYEVENESSPKADDSFITAIPDTGTIEDKRIKVDMSELGNQIEDIPIIEETKKPVEMTAEEVDKIELPNIETFEMPDEDDAINKELRAISDSMYTEVQGLLKSQIDELKRIKGWAQEPCEIYVMDGGEFKGKSIGQVAQDLGPAAIKKKVAEVEKWMNEQDPANVKYEYLRMLAVMERYLEFIK